MTNEFGVEGRHVMFVTHEGVRFVWMDNRMIAMYEKLEVVTGNNRTTRITRRQGGDAPFVIYEENPAAC